LYVIPSVIGLWLSLQSLPSVDIHSICFERPSPSATFSFCTLYFSHSVFLLNPAHYLSSYQCTQISTLACRWYQASATNCTAPIEFI